MPKRFRNVKHIADAIRFFNNKTLRWSMVVTAVLGLLISNVSALAQPYEKSTLSDQNIRFETVNFESHSIHVATSGNPNKPGVLFIHGTPGGWDAFEGYLANDRLRQDFFLVSVDRPGWGKSHLDPKKIDGDFELQAKAIKSVLDHYPDKKWTIIGHSLGASIAPKVALYAPGSVDSILLLAGSLNPKLGKPRWYNWAASTWAIASLIGDSMKYSNREIMGLRKQLKTMDAEIKASKLDTDVVIIQGLKDKLVSPKNPAYAAEQWQETFTSIELIELSDEGHFLPWRQVPLVIQSMYKLRALQSEQTKTID